MYTNSITKAYRVQRIVPILPSALFKEGGSYDCKQYRDTSQGCIGASGAGGETRTRNLRITRPLRYQLRHASILCAKYCCRKRHLSPDLSKQNGTSWYFRWDSNPQGYCQKILSPRCLPISSRKRMFALLTAIIPYTNF